MAWELSNRSIFDDFVRDWSTARRTASRPGVHVWAPPIDVNETDKEFIVHAELPGLTKEQINVDIRDNDLIISGESKKEEKYEKGSTHIQERRFGSFTRSISLPPSVKPDDVSAKFENGILELTLLKSASTTKKINIK